MNQQLGRLTSSVLIACTLFTTTPIASWADNADADNSRQTNMLQGKVGAFGVLSDDIQTKMGFKCVTTQDEDVNVVQVTPGTPASKSGIQAGDRIIDAQLVEDSLLVTIDRK